MEQNEKKVADVVDLSRMYIGPQQRAEMRDRLFNVARKKGFSHNQATALAEQGVREFVAKMDQKRREAAEESKRQNQEPDL